MAQFDDYCERTDATLWSEPLNAVTNLAFLLAAWIMWQRVRGQGLPIAALLCLLLAAIGVGSLLNHTVARSWAAAADVIPIALFVLVYVFAANLHFWRMNGALAMALMLAVLPYTITTARFFSALPFFTISALYWPIPLLIVIYSILLTRWAPDVSRGLSRGAALLVISLVFRSVDELICTAFPLGTHFLWHILNAVMLAWMIEVYRRHQAEVVARDAEAGVE